MIFDIVITELNGKKKNVGEYDSDTNTFTTKRNIEKHLLRKYNAWALDKRLIESELAPKNSIIVILDTKNKTEYRLRAKEFLDLATEINFHEHRPQLYLNRDKFISLDLSKGKLNKTLKASV